MTLKDKLFTMQGDQPYLNPIGINLPVFEKLWNEDTSVDKSQYAKELAYIFHMCDYQSPYYDRPDKEKSIIRDFFGTSSWKPTKRVKNCIDVYNQLQSNAEKRSLDGAIISCDSVVNDLSQTQNESKELENLLRDIDLEIKKNSDDVYIRMELMKEKLNLQKQKLSVAESIANLVPKIEKHVETIQNLRRKVTKAIYEGDVSNKLNDFLFDKLFEEVKYEQSKNEE